MSTKNATSSGGEKNHQKRSCLAVVEADGLFDGKRRVRLHFQSPSNRLSPHDESEVGHSDTVEDNRLREEAELLGLKQSIVNALQLPSNTDASGIEVELYDSKNQSFRRLTRTNEIPSKCCRLRIAITESPSSDSNTNSSSRSQELLALPWREFSSSIDIDGKLVLKGGKHAITIHEVSNSGLGTGTNIWDGAIALAKFLEFHDRDEEDSGDGNSTRRINETDMHLQPDPTYSVRGKRILEIGAGTGLVGIAAHVAFGAREVILTDLEYSLGNLRDNLKANDCRVAKSSDATTTTTSTQSCTIDAMVLDWFDLETCDEVLQQRSILTEGTVTATESSTTNNVREKIPTTFNLWSPEIVLAADVVWVESLVRPLVQTLHRIFTKALQSPPVVLLSYQRRSQGVEDLLFRTLEDFCFRTEDVTCPVVSTTSGAESKIRIFRITYTPRDD